MTTRQLGTWRAADAPGYRCSQVRDGRARDQEDPGEEEPGELLCRVMQTGADTWAGHDARGKILRIKRGRDGALEIRHAAEERTGDDELEDVTGTRPPGATGDPKDRVGRNTATGDAATAFMRTGRAEYHMPGLAAYQKRLDEHYGNK